MCSGPGRVCASVYCVLDISLIDNSSYPIMRNWISPPTWISPQCFDVFLRIYWLSDLFGGKW